jgi:hypothetical protein
LGALIRLSLRGHIAAFFERRFQPLILKVGEVDIILVVFTAAFFLLTFVVLQGLIRGLSQVLWRRRHLNNF